MGPAPNHYRCVRCYIPKTHKKRITNTATFTLRNIPIPNATISDHLRKTVNSLIHLLNKEPNILTPSTPINTQGSLIKIDKLLHKDATPDILPLVNLPSSEGVHAQSPEVAATGFKPQFHQLSLHLYLYIPQYIPHHQFKSPFHLL